MVIGERKGNQKGRYRISFFFKKKKREKLACGTGIGGKAKLPISIVFGNLNALVLPSKEPMTLAESISGIDGEV